MVDPTLLELIESQQGLHPVNIKTNGDSILDVVDLRDHIHPLLERYGLKDQWKAYSCVGDIEAAREQGSDLKDPRFHSYQVKFKSAIAAHTFVMQLNEDTSTQYTASIAKNPIGLGVFNSAERIT